MNYYDNFYKNKHPKHLQRFLILNNKDLIQFILAKFNKNTPIKFLEIGPGKGYVYKAILELNNSKNRLVDYYAIDRNKLILEKLGIGKNGFLGEVPPMPPIKNKFDIIYAAYVAEHLKDGETIYSMINELKKYLSKDGIVVFLTPDCMKQKMEFWNMDYTHKYPTTKRNVSMAFYENEFEIEIFETNGLLVHRLLRAWLIRHLVAFIGYLYNYNLFNSFTSLIYKKPIYSLDNFWYRIYCFAFQQNLIFVAMLNAKRTHPLNNHPLPE